MDDQHPITQRSGMICLYRRKTSSMVVILQTGPWSFSWLTLRSTEFLGRPSPSIVMCSVFVPNENFSFRYVGFLPYNHKVRILFNRLDLFRPYFGLEQGPSVFFDSDRTTDSERTFWFERKSMVGIEKSFGPFLKIDIQLGNSFNREYFTARSFARQHSNLRKIHDGMYGSINLKSSF